MAGRLYIRYRSSSKKNKVGRRMQNLPAYIPLLYPLNKFCYLLSNLRKPKTIWCIWLYYTYQATVWLLGIFLFCFGARMDFNWRATAMKQFPVCKALWFGNFCGFCLCIPGVAHIVRPHPNYWTHALHTVMSLLTMNCVYVCKSSAIVFSIYLVYF